MESERRVIEFEIMRLEKIIQKEDLTNDYFSSGFHRALSSLFGEDVEYFAPRLFFNVDKLEKKLNAEEFNDEIAMVVFKVLKNQLQKFITMQIHIDSDDQKTNYFFTEYTLYDAQMFQTLLISSWILLRRPLLKEDCIKEYMLAGKMKERCLRKRERLLLIVKKNSGTKSEKQADDSRSGNDTHVEEGMISTDASEIDNNVAGASHDKDNITEVQSSNNEMFAKILKKTKNASETFEKTKTDHKMLNEENVLLKKEIKAYKERVRDFNEEQYIEKLEQAKEELQDQVLKIKNATDSVKKAFKQDEDKYVNNIIQFEPKNKDLENIENKRKMGLGYTDPCPLGQAIASHPKLYDDEVISYQTVKPDVHDTKEILNDAEESQIKMKEKQFQFNYENINSLYDTFVPQTKLSPEQEYFTDPSISSEYESSKECRIYQLQKCQKKFYVEIKNKEEIEQFSKESKDGDKFCNDVVEVKEKLSKQIVQLEKDFAKLEAQSIAFEIALHHKTQENKSLKTLQKENENFMVSLQIENAHLKQNYKDLFKSVQSSRVENIQCDEVKIKFNVDKIETQNIELEHQVASLIKDNEHLKLTYQNLFDSIKKSRVQTKTSMQCKMRQKICCGCRRDFYKKFYNSLGSVPNRCIVV
ncbi:hypothetical protein Tco_1577544 [Tanacetum coccineum]